MDQNAEQPSAATNPQQLLEQQSLQVLALAAQGYLKDSQDELGRTFIQPQLQGALNHIGSLIERHYAPAADLPALDPGHLALIEAAAAAANDDIPADAAAT